MNKVIRAIIIVAIMLFLGIFAYSAYQLTSTLHEYREAERFNDSVAKQYASFSEDAAPQGGTPQGGTPRRQKHHRRQGALGDTAGNLSARHRFHRAADGLP